MLRSVCAVLGGFATMAIVVMLGSVVLVAAFVPGGLKAVKSRDRSTMPPPTARYFGLNLVLSFLAAVLGGWVTARIATHAPVAHVEALGAFIVVMGVVSAFSRGSERQPQWYRFVIPLVGLAGVATSALVFAPTA